MENYVIVRAARAGVFFGKLLKKDGSEVTMTNCRKLFYWDGACSVEQLAVDGINANKISNCKFTVSVNDISILEVIQILPCTKKSIDSINSVPEWKK